MRLIESNEWKIPVLLWTMNETLNDLADIMKQNSNATSYSDGMKAERERIRAAIAEKKSELTGEPGQEVDWTDLRMHDQGAIAAYNNALDLLNDPTETKEETTDDKSGRTI